MKAFFTVIFALACAVVLFLGNSYWNEKTAISADTGDHTGSNETANLSKEKTVSPESLLQYTKNWPSESVDKLKQTIFSKRPFKIAIIGSTALGGDPDGWAYIAKQKLTDVYGAENLSVEVKEYDMTSAEFVKGNKQDELAAVKADLILFEPFTLKDNGAVATEDSLANIKTIMNDVKTANPETVFILQPPNPIFNAKFYPVQVSELKQYAQENKIPYLDHWTAWPDPAKEELKQYLLDDQSGPNQQGHELWAKFVTDYLVSEK